MYFLSFGNNKLGSHCTKTDESNPKHHSDFISEFQQNMIEKKARISLGDHVYYTFLATLKRNKNQCYDKKGLDVPLATLFPDLSPRLIRDHIQQLQPHFGDICSTELNLLLKTLSKKQRGCTNFKQLADLQLIRIESSQDSEIHFDTTMTSETPKFVSQSETALPQNRLRLLSAVGAWDLSECI